jgi:hypothetical protein
MLVLQLLPESGVSPIPHQPPHSKTLRDLGHQTSRRRARLFREKPYPWNSPQDDLAAAEKLINDCGYHRRDPELADAKKAILGS